MRPCRLRAIRCTQQPHEPPMKPSIVAKLEQLASRLTEIDALLSSQEATRNMDQYRRISKEHADLTPVVERFTEFQKAGQDVADAQAMLSDPEMKAYAEAEVREGKARVEALERANDWLRRVGLGGFGHRDPHQLSGGQRKRVSLAQTLIMDPQIILMDEPFSALDVQTRQLMENELLDLWQADRKSVVFITHDLDEAIALSDRVVVLSAGPETHPIGDYIIDLPRPRDVSEIRMTPRFIELHSQIWRAMKDEVLKGYVQQQQK